MSQISTLEAHVRILLQEVSQQYFFSTEIRQAIGEAYRHYALVMLDEGEGYFETAENVGFTAGVKSIALSSLSQTAFRISYIRRNLSNGQKKLKRSERRSRVSTFMVGAGDGYLPTWKLRGNNIILEPTPTQTEAASDTTGLEVEYSFLPTFPDSASADGFTFDAGFSTIYEPMIEIYAAIYMIENKLANNAAIPTHDFGKRQAKWEKVFWDSLERDEDPDEIEYEGGDYSQPFL
jgi:hypothetical protein